MSYLRVFEGVGAAAAMFSGGNAQCAYIYTFCSNPFSFSRYGNFVCLHKLHTVLSIVYGFFDVMVVVLAC